MGLNGVILTTSVTVYEKHCRIQRILMFNDLPLFVYHSRSTTLLHAHQTILHRALSSFQPPNQL